MSELEMAYRRVEELRGKFTKRDANMRIVRQVREGKMHEIADMNQYFSDELPRSLVENTVRTAAEDMRNVMGSLPALDCSAGNGISQADKKRATKKNRIGRDIWEESKLETEFLRFADHYNTYGVAVLAVEPDFARRKPILRVEDPTGFYYLKDRWGCVTECARIWDMPLDALCALFPEHAQKLKYENHGSSNVEVVRYTHRDHGTVFYATAGRIALQTIDSVIEGYLPYFVVEQPHLGEIPTGRFDETVWIQYAKVLMAQYMFRAAERSINAPFVLPRDVGQFEEGVDAQIFTDNWRPGMGIAQLNIPNDIFAYNQQLDESAKESAGYPDARNGRINASIVTGRGVEALMGTFDTTVKTAQMLFKKCLEEATCYAFMLYNKFFGNVTHTIGGVDNGQTYRDTFTPSRDIGDDYAVVVTYGFMLGNSPAQAVMMLLQFRNDDLISRDSVRKKLPWNIDSDVEQRLIDQQRLNDSIIAGVAAYSQSAGILLQQGMSPDQVFTPLVKLIQAREAGKNLAEAALEAFTPPEVEGAPAAELGEPPMPGMPEGMGPGGPPNMAPSGLLRGVAPGQAGMPPGGLPTIMNLAAGLRGDQGSPQMSSTVLRRRATGS